VSSGFTPFRTATKNLSSDGDSTNTLLYAFRGQIAPYHKTIRESGWQSVRMGETVRGRIAWSSLNGARVMLEEALDPARPTHL
jgi:hypothetical protein